MKRCILLIFALVLFSTHVLRAEDPAEAYLDVYNLIQQADTLNASGKSQEAQVKYRQAEAALKNFRKNHPEWQPKTVEYRANYLALKIQQLSSTNAVATQSNRPAASGSSPPQSQSQSPGGVSVKLISPGGEPRAPLRLHPKAGDKQTSTMTMKATIEMSLGGNKMPETPNPAIVITSEATIKSVSPEGDITYEIITKDVQGMPQLKDLSASGTLTSRGISKNIDVKVPSGLAPELRQLADQMKEAYSTAAQPLPEEPVGVGAKWEAKIPIKSGGMSIMQTYTCELASLEGDKAVVRINYTQTGPNQKVENPAMPGVTMNLTHFTGSGSGESILDLGKILPTQSTMDGQLELALTTTGAQKQDITMKMTLNVTTDTK